MKKTLSYNHSIRLTLQNQGWGWFNTDPSVKLAQVASLVPDHEEQLKMVASGAIDDIDLNAPTSSFWAQDKDGEFLGYVKLRFPTVASVAQRIWPKLEGKPVKPA